ncbi:phage tail tape measure protein [Prosthecomicrobium sp. N25]|uniref:phage tail tape measure protein n=1 Tax=Prosthecomicrobium sp. N25 TaxID=3129254 RepID=UPI0030782843
MTDGLDPGFDMTARLSGSLAELTQLSTGFGTALTSAFRGAVLQGRELDSVLRGIGYSISSASLDRALAPISSGIASGLETAVAGAFRSVLGFRLGGAIGEGRVMPFADGGVVSRPTFFPMAGGRTGLMGEAGAEAILPLRRGADGKLGVAAASGGPQTVNVTFNVTTPDAESFRRSEAQIQTKLARAVGRGRRGL